jgi:hypothetical protein
VVGRDVGGCVVESLHGEHLASGKWGQDGNISAQPCGSPGYPIHGQSPLCA